MTGFRDNDLALANSMVPEIMRQVEAQFARVWPQSSHAYERVTLDDGTVSTVKHILITATAQSGPFDAARLLLDMIGRHAFDQADFSWGIMWRDLPLFDELGRLPQWKVSCRLGFVPPNAVEVLPYGGAA